LVLLVLAVGLIFCLKLNINVNIYLVHCDCLEVGTYFKLFLVLGLGIILGVGLGIGVNLVFGLMLILGLSIGRFTLFVGREYLDEND